MAFNMAIAADCRRRAGGCSSSRPRPDALCFIEAAPVVFNHYFLKYHFRVDPQPDFAGARMFDDVVKRFFDDEKLNCAGRRW